MSYTPLHVTISGTGTDDRGRWWHGLVKIRVNGLLFEHRCPHDHRTEEAAVRCATHIQRTLDVAP